MYEVSELSVSRFQACVIIIIYYLKLEEVTLSVMFTACLLACLAGAAVAVGDWIKIALTSEHVPGFG